MLEHVNVHLVPDYGDVGAVHFMYQQPHLGGSCNGTHRPFNDFVDRLQTELRETWDVLFVFRRMDDCNVYFIIVGIVCLAAHVDDVENRIVILNIDLDRWILDGFEWMVVAQVFHERKGRDAISDQVLTDIGQFFGFYIGDLCRQS